MTELQIKAQALAEEKRHNLATEKLSHAQNAITAQHYTAQDTYTAEHYQRSDTAGLISANANAMNAETNRAKLDIDRFNAETSRISAEASAANAETNRKAYEMNYDIEYGWTGDSYFPKGMPLSAQVKTVQGINAIYDSELKREEAKTQRAEQEKKAAETAVLQVEAPTTIVNAIFGRSGILGGISNLLRS